MPIVPFRSPTQERAQLFDVNEEAIRLFLLHVAEDKPSSPRECEHGQWPVRLCLSKKKKSSMENIGRWYSFCGLCKKWRWLSPRLDVNMLLRDEHFATLIATHESLRNFSRARATSRVVSGINQTPTPGPEPRNRTRSSGGFVSSASPAHGRAIQKARESRMNRAGPCQRLPGIFNSLPQTSVTMTLIFWTQDSVNPFFVEVPRSAGEAFCLRDHKMLLGQFDVEQVDAYEIYNKLTRSWNGIRWDKPIFPGGEDVLFFRLQGVTSLPRHSALISSFS
ncbi:hypothetical protein NP233_g3359 [Leucocoprinus birnbaumii]|uniref:Uncharacterized protein n=1 Tax=Leucocoprinus birnbaumii TaxID=56174 RepID=A0AAD5VY30_9AGAR|nr:hypothetical protein NP233_g3359 [Leucocoprinus birnbaumii]